VREGVCKKIKNKEKAASPDYGAAAFVYSSLNPTMDLQEDWTVLAAAERRVPAYQESHDAGRRGALD
jgi:hypothetical protein